MLVKISLCIALLFACATTVAQSAGGSDTNVQFNDAGVLAGSPYFNWKKIARTLTISGFVENDGQTGQFTNTYFGHLANGALSSTGGNNTGFGSVTLYSNYTGSDLTAVGSGALYANSTGNDNTAIGYAALSSNATGYNNTAVGSNALLSETTATGNTAVGYLALYYDVTGNDNTAVGHRAAQQTTGNYNVAIGKDAMAWATTGSFNTCIGQDCMWGNDAALGGPAITGHNNTAVGQAAFYTLHDGSYNVAVGQMALGGLTDGNNNVAIGWYSGAYQGSPANWNTTGSNNVWIGYETGPNTGQSQVSNSVAIGYRAASSKSNQVLLGNSTTQDNVINGHLAITHDPAGGTGVSGTGTNICSLAYGNDTAGQVLIPAGAATCTVYFQHSFTNPVCTVTPSISAIAPLAISQTSATLTMMVSSGSSSGFINYHCEDVQ